MNTRIFTLAIWGQNSFITFDLSFRPSFKNSINFNTRIYVTWIILLILSIDINLCNNCIILTTILTSFMPIERIPLNRSNKIFIVSFSINGKRKKISLNTSNDGKNTIVYENVEERYILIRISEFTRIIWLNILYNFIETHVFRIILFN